MKKAFFWLAWVIAGTALLLGVQTVLDQGAVLPQALLTQEQKETLTRFPMSVNRASKEDLMEAEGIGEKISEDILSYIQHRGPVTSMKEPGKRGRDRSKPPSGPGKIILCAVAENNLTVQISVLPILNGHDPLLWQNGHRKNSAVS